MSDQPSRRAGSRPSKPIKPITDNSYSKKIESLARYSQILRFGHVEDLPNISLPDLIQDLCNRTDIRDDTKKTYWSALRHAVLYANLPDEAKRLADQRLEAIRKRPGPKPKQKT